jgi:Tripartite tricarboxylate transporter family receptor
VSGFCFRILVFSLLSFSAAAQNYPSKPLRVVVPFPVGGIADLYARLIGNRWSEAWGQPVLVENRAGAGGNIAAEMVAKSAPDGYTLVMGSVGTHAVNVSLFAKLPYDPLRDFAPVALALDADGPAAHQVGQAARPRHHRRGACRRHARAVRRVREKRNRQVGGGQGFWREGGLIAAKRRAHAAAFGVTCA